MMQSVEEQRTNEGKDMDADRWAAPGSGRWFAACKHLGSTLVASSGGAQTHVTVNVAHDLCKLARFDNQSRAFGCIVDFTTLAVPNLHQQPRYPASAVSIQETV
jgi:hypothetical protein